MRARKYRRPSASLCTLLLSALDRWQSQTGQTEPDYFLVSSSLDKVLMISSFLAWRRSSLRLRASFVLERRASAWSLQDRQREERSKCSQQYPLLLACFWKLKYKLFNLHINTNRTLLKIKVKYVNFNPNPNHNRTQLPFTVQHCKY